MGMAHGYAGMASFVSLQMGLVWVIGCTLLFGGAYLIGATKGGRAAATYTATMTWMFILGFVGIASYAFVIGEVQTFFENYGYAVIVEMFLLSLGCVWIMWFMATQYSRGRIAIDERFGSKENYLRAKEAAKRASRDGLILAEQPELQPDALVDPALAAAPMVDPNIAIPAAPATFAADATSVLPQIDPATGMPVAAVAPVAAPAAVDFAANQMAQQAPGQPVAPAVPGMPVAAVAPVSQAPAFDPQANPPVPAVPAVPPVPAVPAVPLTPSIPMADGGTGQFIPEPTQPPVSTSAPSPLSGMSVPTVDPQAGQAAPAFTSIQQPQTDQLGPAPATIPPLDPFGLPSASQPDGQDKFAATPDFVSQAMSPSASDILPPVPLGPSAPSHAPESNEDWLQQLGATAVSAPTPATAAPVPGALDAFSSAPAHAPAQASVYGAQPVPYAGQPAPGYSAPAVDPYTGQPIPAPGQYGQPPAIDPYTAQQIPYAGQPAPGYPAPAVDPYTGQPIPAPGQYGQPPTIDPYTGQPIPAPQPGQALPLQQPPASGAPGAPPPPFGQ